MVFLSVHGLNLSRNIPSVFLVLFNQIFSSYRCYLIKTYNLLNLCAPIFLHARVTILRQNKKYPSYISIQILRIGVNSDFLCPRMERSGHIVLPLSICPSIRQSTRPSVSPSVRLAAQT